MTRKARKTQSGTVPAMVQVQLPTTNDPKALYEVAIAAQDEESRCREVRYEAIRRLRSTLGGRSSFSMEGRVFQIRERNGNPYLVMMPVASEVPKL